MRSIAWIALAAGLAACSHVPTYTAHALPAAEQQAARELVRTYAKAHCGSCHQSSLPTARPAALAIYNLDSDNWSSTLTAAQLRNGLPRRLNSRLDEAGRQQLRRFIEGELALR